MQMGLDTRINTLYSTVVEDDPLRIHVTIETDTDGLTLPLDDTMTVLAGPSGRWNDSSHGQDSNSSGRTSLDRSDCEGNSTARVYRSIITTSITNRRLVTAAANRTIVY